MYPIVRARIRTSSWYQDLNFLDGQPAAWPAGDRRHQNLNSAAADKLIFVTVKLAVQNNAKIYA